MLAGIIIRKNTPSKPPRRNTLSALINDAIVHRRNGPRRLCWLGLIFEQDTRREKDRIFIWLPSTPCWTAAENNVCLCDGKKTPAEWKERTLSLNYPVIKTLVSEDLHRLLYINVSITPQTRQQNKCVWRKGDFKSHLWSFKPSKKGMQWSFLIFKYYCTSTTLVLYTSPL